MDAQVLPIHRLPTELLRSILLFSVGKGNASCWKCGHIDSRLRGIALATPHLWTEIIINQYPTSNFSSLTEKLRVQLHRCGPVVPLSIYWNTCTTVSYLSQLLLLFIENGASFDRWRFLMANACDFFPDSMLEDKRLGEFTGLEELILGGVCPKFFFHHLKKTRAFKRLERLQVDDDGVEIPFITFDELATDLPKVMSTIKELSMDSKANLPLVLPQNIVILSLRVLNSSYHFHYLTKLSIQHCAILLSPPDIPLVTHLDVYFETLPPENLVLEYPSLTSLVLRTVINDLRPLTWLAAPNLAFLEIKYQNRTSCLDFHRDGPPFTKLKFLTYPSVSEVRFNSSMPPDLVQTLLPLFPAMQTFAIQHVVTLSDKMIALLGRVRQ
ncbi:SubName: Full=Uncharacterized protein {ECO:0000313/EMBL:CCA75986.1} [Serendipita indica DSM 11827]|nr:SubName: Full=Uncharacterized protein {ECO:0000313/EMBL:CCA75986.1} [Serendipita indica DSM 11827]